MQQASLGPASELERRIDFSLPRNQVESEIATRLKRIARSAKLPGFRPGKVPLKLVEQQYGGKVREEVIGDSVQKTFSEVIRQQNLRIAGYPRIQAKTPPGDDLEFVATFEVYPEVTLGDLSAVTFERPVTEVTDEDVERTIEILRKQRTHYHDVERGAQPGDRVRIDFDGRMDGEPFTGGQGKDQLFVIGDGRLLPDFHQHLTGMAKGEERTFELTFPADYHDDKLAGRTASFTVKLHEVAEPHVPELDARFAESLGISDGDPARLRDEIKVNLQREAKKRIQARLREQVMQALIDRSSLTLPSSLVEMETQRMAVAALEDLQSKGMLRKDMQIPPEAFREEAERRVRLGLILGEMVKQHHLQAKPEQVRAIVEEHAQSYEQPAELVRWYYENPQRLSEAEALVLENNVVDWALQHGQTNDRPTPFRELVDNAT